MIRISGRRLSLARYGSCPSSVCAVRQHLQPGLPSGKNLSKLPLEHVADRGPAVVRHPLGVDSPMTAMSICSVSSASGKMSRARTSTELGNHRSSSIWRAAARNPPTGIAVRLCDIQSRSARRLRPSKRQPSSRRRAEDRGKVGTEGPDGPPRYNTAIITIAAKSVTAAVAQ